MSNQAKAGLEFCGPPYIWVQSTKHSSFLWMQPARFACDLAQHIEATDTITKKTILAKASCATSTWTMLKYVGIGVKNARANVIKFQPSDITAVVLIM